MANILMVDDDVDLTGLVDDYLTFEEHTVTVVHRGLDGWKQLQTNEFQLVILDWDLPDIKGIELLKRYRATGSNTPIIMLTGRSSIDDKGTGFDSGANDYLTKPFHPKELSARINAVLRTAAASAPPPPKALGTGNADVLKVCDLSGTALAARYEFLEVIGQGGAAVVFKARQPHMDKLMAIKMLRATQLHAESVSRFSIEARALSKIDHPNIIIIHDFGITEHNEPYMVMEYIEGQSLLQLLSEQDHLPLKLGLETMYQVCDGLAFAHENGILHRDIKPSNIMIKRSSNQALIPKILDFGLAKLTEDCSHDSLQLTSEQQVFGSPLYMSPEQARGMKLDARSDIYQLGCVIFETLTGYQPILGNTPQSTMVAQIVDTPYSFQEVQPDIEYPPELEHLVSKSLQKNPDDRYQTMQELKQDLGKIIEKLR